ncbi:37S ribosomal protein S16, mitochondrial [Sporothrix eucalyptigena]|uniref:37S ribosomal protein S16, mitochondrial n=1 Tax=Sporothrix eucalyptigena TaxID=1812306 RepID=A0ABP0CSJ0_9PEZI
MVVKIRLARFGRTNSPIYNIVVMQARTARNSRPMEVLGTYNPKPQHDAYEFTPSGTPTQKAHKDIQLDVTRTKYWIGVGAQPTEPMWRILSMVGILEPKKLPAPTPKATPVEKA